ncbi:glucose 1-dehydrogenase [Furfurilactobacillus sp. WILCCON 0119]
MTARLTDKVAIITGGTKGIGLACAAAFLREGAKVVITSRNDADGQAALAGLNGGDNAIYLQQDAADEARFKQVIDETVAVFGKLDVIVNNAGIAIAKDVEHTTAEEWHQLMGINLDGVFYGTKYGMIAMKDHGGSIINMSSIEGFIGDPQLAAYNASKGGVRLFSKSAALYAAQQNYGVRVNTVHPGYIKTPLVNAHPGMEEAQAKLTPVGHIGEPDDIANICVYLASDESKFATGSEFVVDGGYTAQ